MIPGMIIRKIHVTYLSCDTWNITIPAEVPALVFKGFCEVELLQYDTTGPYGDREVHYMHLEILARKSVSEQSAWLDEN